MFFLMLSLKLALHPAIAYAHSVTKPPSRLHCLCLLLSGKTDCNYDRLSFMLDTDIKPSPPHESSNLANFVIQAVLCPFSYAFFNAGR